jgi:hypothetical protein
MRDEQGAASVETDAANPVETVEYDTSVTAGETTDTAILKALIEFALGCVGFKNVFESIQPRPLIAAKRDARPTTTES